MSPRHFAAPARAAIPWLAAGLLACAAEPLAPSPDLRPGIAERQVTLDFSSVGLTPLFDPDFFRKDGLRLAPERCGTLGCTTWSVDLIQSDAALLGEPGLRGPTLGSFIRPVSALSLQVAPALQGTATYTLTAYTASGRPIAATSVTVTQDSGDPANTGFGYFTVSLVNLPRPAKRFSFDNVFVRSSFPTNTFIPYGISAISYVHWGGR